MAEIPDDVVDHVSRILSERNLYGPRGYGEKLLDEALKEVRALTENDNEVFQILNGLVEISSEDIPDDDIAGELLEKVAHAINIAFYLGRTTKADIKKAEQLKFKQRLAGITTGKIHKAKADEWRLPAQKLYYDVRGKFLKISSKPPSQLLAAKTIRERLRHLSPPDPDEIKKKYIPIWDQCVRRGDKLPWKNR